MSTATFSNVAGRPATATAAAALLAVLAVLGVIAAPIGAEEHGASFVVICLVLSAIRAVAAAGVWRGWRWAAILGIAVTLLDTLLNIPAIFDGTSGALLVLSMIALPLDVAALVLLARRTSRRAYA
jgi:hypothetical protein